MKPCPSSQHDTGSTDRAIVDHVGTSAGHDSSHGSAHHGEHVHPHVVLCFMLTCIVMGIFTMYALSHIHRLHAVPFTVALFIEGICLGALHSATDGGLGSLSASLDMWLEIDPHLLLYAFLPALLFGDSMCMSWIEFRGCASQCLLLAGPGTVIGCALTGMFMMFVANLGWSSHICLAFGSILAATDPVAVVALLKEMGVDKTLTMQIMGESLMNDGVAIVIWTMFFQMSKGATYTIGEIILFFLQLAAGGVFMGGVFGIVTLYAIAKASDKLQHHDHLIQLALTLSCAYLSFFIGEAELHVSGVLACIFAALVLAKQAWPVFCSRDGVEHVWHAIEFIGNTLIFLLAGSIFGQLIVEKAGPSDWWLLIQTWAAMMVIRGTMLVVLYPILSRIGHGLSLKEMLVVWWGGLRGAVGLALALAMKKDPQVDPDTGDQILWLVCGAAGMTMLINAPTCGPLISYLKLSTPPEARERLVAKLRFASAKVTVQICNQMRQWPMFGDHWVDELSLKHYVSALRLRDTLLQQMLCTWNISQRNTTTTSEIAPFEVLGIYFEEWKKLVQSIKMDSHDQHHHKKKAALAPENNDVMTFGKVASNLAGGMKKVGNMVSRSASNVGGPNVGKEKSDGETRSLGMEHFGSGNNKKSSERSTRKSEGKKDRKSVKFGGGRKSTVAVDPNAPVLVHEKRRSRASVHGNLAARKSINDKRKSTIKAARKSNAVNADINLDNPEPPAAKVEAPEPPPIEAAVVIAPEKKKISVQVEPESYQRESIEVEEVSDLVTEKHSKESKASKRAYQSTVQIQSTTGVVASSPSARQTISAGRATVVNTASPWGVGNKNKMGCLEEGSDFDEDDDNDMPGERMKRDFLQNMHVLPPELVKEAFQEHYDQFDAEEILNEHSDKLSGKWQVDLKHGRDEQEMDGDMGTGKTTSKPSLKVEMYPNELKVERELFLSMLRSEYWAQMSAGRLPDNSTAGKKLLASVDAALDEARIALLDWNDIMNKIMLTAPPETISGKLVRRIKELWGDLNHLSAMGVGFKKYVPVRANGVTFDAFCPVCFVDAHLATQEKMADGGVLGRLTPARVHVLLESLSEVAQVWRFLDEHLTPEAIKTVRTKQLALSVLTKQRSVVTDWMTAGIVLPGEAEQLLECVHHDFEALEDDGPFSDDEEDSDDDDDWDAPQRQTVGAGDDDTMDNICERDY